MSGRPAHRTVLAGLATVFRRPGNVVLAALVALTMLLTAVWLPHGDLFRFIVSSQAFTWPSKIQAVLVSAGWFLIVPGLATAAVAVLAAALCGVEVAMAVHLARRRLALAKSVGAGLVGGLLAMLGLGCAACSASLLSALLGTSLSVSLLAVLPLGGLGLGLLGLAVLTVTLYPLAVRIVEPPTC